MRPVYVLFNSNRPPRGWTVAWCWSAVIDRLSGPFLHVSIADPAAGVVLSPHWAGHRTWPLSAYGDEYPHLLCGFEVPVSDCDLSAIESRPYSWAHTLARYLTGGHFDPPDCVGIARRLLIGGGVDVPPMPTPLHLHHWLYRRGFKHVQFDG